MTSTCRPPHEAESDRSSRQSARTAALPARPQGSHPGDPPRRPSRSSASRQNRPTATSWAANQPTDALALHAHRAHRRRDRRGPRSVSSRSAALLAASTSPPGRPPRPSVVDPGLSPVGREDRPHAALSTSSRSGPRGARGSPRGRRPGRPCPGASRGRIAPGCRRCCCRRLGSTSDRLLGLLAARSSRRSRGCRGPSPPRGHRTAATPFRLDGAPRHPSERRRSLGAHEAAPRDRHAGTVATRPAAGVALALGGVLGPPLFGIHRVNSDRSSADSESGSTLELNEPGETEGRSWWSPWGSRALGCASPPGRLVG